MNNAVDHKLSKEELRNFDLSATFKFRSLYRNQVATKTSRVRLSDLTAETVRVQTKSGDTPLHRACKNGQLNEVPSHLLTADLFMIQNGRQETPLHYATKHGTLNQVPRQFLTRQTMTVPDYCGRTPLHISASYKNFYQIPPEFLTAEYLTLRTSVFTKNTVLHVLAEQNLLHFVPKDVLTSDLLSIKNGYEATPMDVLSSHLPTEGQKLRLDAIGYTADRSLLTKEQASAIIQEHEEKNQVYAPSLPKEEPAEPIKLTYIKRELVLESSGGEQSWKVVLLAKSSSGGKPYNVEFILQGSDLLAWCHCPGGAKSLCKHLLALLQGDAKMLFDAKQRPEFGDLQALPQFTALKCRIEEYQKQVQEFDNRSFAETDRFNEWYDAFREARSPSRRQGIGSGPIQFVFVTPTADYMDAPEVQAKLKETKEKKAVITKEKGKYREAFMRCLRTGFRGDELPFRAQRDV